MDNVSDSTFMEKVREYRVIYDKSSRGYKDPVQKKNAWKEIAEFFEQPIDELQKRYASVRTKFSRYLRKTQCTKTGQERDAVPPLSPEFEHLHWLRIFIKHRRTSSRRLDDSDLSDRSSGDEDTMYTPRPTSPDDLALEHPEQMAGLHKKAKWDNCGKGRRMHDDSMISTSDRSSALIMDPMAEETSEERLFCLSLVRPLSMMDARMRSLAKLEILRVIHHIEFQAPPQPRFHNMPAAARSHPQAQHQYRQPHSNNYLNHQQQQQQQNHHQQPQQQPGPQQQYPQQSPQPQQQQHVQPVQQVQQQQQYLQQQQQLQHYAQPSQQQPPPTPSPQQQQQPPPPSLQQQQQHSQPHEQPQPPSTPQSQHSLTQQCSPVCHQSMSKLQPPAQQQQQQSSASPAQDQSSNVTPQHPSHALQHSSSPYPTLIPPPPFDNELTPTMDLD